jgi:Dolichyl-phosphate-mannose-protein mannosyltransferase
MLATFAMMVWGLTGDCPYRPEFDEVLSVRTALNMVKTGDLNPHWLAHPGSTLIYPLATYFHFLNATYFHGVMADPNFDIPTFEYDNVFLLFYIPRYLNVFLLVGSIPVIYAITRDAFNRQTALFAIWIFAISPLIISWSQLLRSDSSALFYTLVAVYACIKLYRGPSWSMQTLFGVALGLGVSSRWPSLAVLQVFVFVHGYLLYQHRKDRKELKRIVLLAAYGLALAFLIFAATSPYVFLDTATLRKDLVEEKAAHGLGCDGLSPWQNFMWYLTAGIPQELFQPQWALALVGAGLALWRRQFLAITLAVYALAILVGTSLHVFHAVKWLVPVMPLFAMFCASALTTGGDYVHRKLSEWFEPKLGLVCYALILTGFMFYMEKTPLLQVCKQNYSRSYISTDILFYEWMNNNIPHGTSVCFVGVWEGAHKSNFNVLDVLWDPSYFDVACGGKYQSPYDIYNQGYKYFIWTDNHCPLYLAEPNKYPRECKFFKELFDNGEIVKEIEPEELTVKNLFTTPQRGFHWRLYKFVPKVPMAT